MTARTIPPPSLDDGLLLLPVQDGLITYVEAGSGPPVVLLHGGLLDHRMWAPQLASLSARHRVVAPDLRGHGRSSSATTPGRYCDDVAALVHHLGGGPATLVGLSMGAGVAVDAALEHPHLVSALVVMGAGTSQPEFRDPWLLQILADWERTREALDLEGFLSACDRLVAGPYRDVSAVPPALLSQHREMVTHTVTAHLAAGPPHVVPVTDTWARLGQITCPVLGVVGGCDSDDHIGMVERLVHAVPDGRTATVGGTSHYPNLERPEYVTALLVDFLRQDGVQSAR